MENLIEVIDSLKSKEITHIMIAVGVLVCFIILSSIFAKIIMRCFKIKSSKLNRNTKMYKLLKLIWIISGIYISLLILKLPENFMSVVTKIYKLVLIYGITRIAASFVGPNIRFFNKLREGNENSKNEYTMNFIIRCIRGIIYIIGAFVFIAELGYDLSGLVTGLGIGSVVLALAAQDLAKNMFGGFAIITDKTFVVGDAIEVNGTYGVVEDISFRTTRIRKTDNTVVTIPNSALADSEIINWNKIQKRRYETDLKFSHELSQKQLNNLKNKILDEIEKNENVIENSARVYFSAIENDGYNLKVYLYTDIIDYDEYIEFVSNINLQILNLLEQEKTKLNYPTYDIHMVNR